MANAIRRNPVGLVGQFVLPSKTLRRGGLGNTWISRQEFNITPARPMGILSAGSRGITQFPPR